MNSEEGKDPLIQSEDSSPSAEILPDYAVLKDSLERLAGEHSALRREYASAMHYLREKINQLLTVMGTLPLKPEELDDKTLIETDPIGIISNSFVQILKHLHRTNDRLKIANQEINAIFDSAGAGILVIDKEMNIVAYNAKLKEQFFPDRTDINGQLCFKAICNKPDSPDDCPCRTVLASGKGVHLAGRVMNGRFFDIVCTPVKDSRGEVLQSVHLYLDITDRIHMEQELRRSEEKYRDLFENANDLIQSIAPDGSIRYVNRAWREALGYAEHEVPALSIFDVIHPDCVECGTDFKSVVFGKTSGRIETIFITKNGKKLTVEGNISSIVSDGTFAGTRGIFRDITERKEAEEKLASEREQLAVTLRCIGDGVITTDTAGNIVLMNKISEALTGWSQQEAKGRPIREVFRLIDEYSGEPREDPVTILLGSGQAVELPDSTLLVARDGVKRLISDSVSPIVDSISNMIGTVLVFRDITEKKQVEERLLKAEKIESLGILAGGIAHDFNNLLSAIMGNIDLAAMELAPGDEALESLSRAEKAVVRAADLTQQLLTFSKGGAPIKKAASITELLRDSADFVLRGSNTRCQFDLPEDLWKVEIDPGQICQVINNVLLNAVHAMPDGGEIHLVGRNTIIENDQPELKGGRYVTVTIQDTGIGIPKEHLQKIFEPYFTTKHSGSGLGLATSYSIMKRHDGLIEVESEAGKGTLFSLYLPAFSGTVIRTTESAEKMSVTKIEAKVLLMDDDAMVRLVAGEMLKQLGCEAVLAADGSETLETYRSAADSGSPFDVVILDLTIPGGMGGKETIQKLVGLNPDVKAVVSSGYSGDAIMANYRQHGFSGVLSKPYQIRDLAGVLRELLGGD